MYYARVFKYFSITYYIVGPVIKGTVWVPVIAKEVHSQVSVSQSSI